MKDLYTKISDVLTDEAAVILFQSRSLIPVKFIDVYKQQYLNPQTFELTLLPAIFFEWAVDHTLKTATISIHIVYEQKRDTSSLGTARAEALKYFDYIATVNELLIGIESTTTGKLVLTNEAPAQEDVIETVYILTYICPYTEKTVDAISKWNYTDETAEPVISGVIVKEL